jgi:uncharacterized protein with FMN-binding domain
MKKVLIPLLAVLGLAAVGDLLYRSASSHDSSSTDTATAATPAPTSTTTTSSSADITPTTNPSAAATKDGTYTATGNYTSPDGNEAIGVSLTVASGTITAVTVTPQGDAPESKQYEQRFADGIASVVVGKQLASTFDVSEVNGSSLTGTGFQAALTSIRSQAS